MAEVRAFLERKEIEEGPREYALDELADAGALDDARFAMLFAEDRRSIDSWGIDRIERALERRGVGREHIAAALAGQDRDDELDAAVTLLAAKVAPPETDRDRDKAWRMLVRKGYEPEVAYDAVRRHAA